MASLLPALAESMPWTQSRADTLDRDSVSPDQEIDRLRQLGALTIPMPVHGHDKDDPLADGLASIVTPDLAVSAPTPAPPPARRFHRT
jgi:hypothetical protein